MSRTITNGPTTGYGLRRGDGTLLPVGDTALILGRAVGGVGRLDDPRVSARHARVCRTGRGLRIEDLGSTNGTWVAGRSVTVHLLADRDLVRLGQTLLVAVTPPSPTGDIYADAETSLRLLERWELLIRRAPRRDTYMSWMADVTGISRERLYQVKSLRNRIAHARGPVRWHQAERAFRLVSEVERLLEGRGTA